MDTSKCTEIIEKIAENHVIVKKVLYTSTGEEVVIDIVEYGQEKIDNLLAQSIESMQKWENVKIDTKIIDSEISKLQSDITKLNIINTQMKAR